MDTPEQNNRPRNASGSGDKRPGNATPRAATSSHFGLETCFSRIAEAERQLAAPIQAASFLVKPALLDSRELTAGSAQALTRELSFDADATEQLGLRIELPASGEIRIRKLISRSRRVMTGKYPSWKVGRLVHWESRLESAVFRLLDVCPGVATFSEQPFTIFYLDEGSWHAHVPDVAVLTFDGRILILEIKSCRDRALAGAIRRAALIAPRLRCLGLNYAIALEPAIKAGTSLLNAETLVRAGRGFSTAKADEAMRGLVIERSSVSQSDLIGLVVDQRRAFHTAAGLVMRGDLSLNWCDANSKPLRILRLTENNHEESLSWLQRALGVIR